MHIHPRRPGNRSPLIKRNGMKSRITAVLLSLISIGIFSLQNAMAQSKVVSTPSEYMGACMSDLQNRRALIEGMGSEKGFEVIKARVPLAELYRYSTTLSSLSSGSATFTMDFADYQPVPGDVQDKLLKAYLEEEKED